MTFPFAALSTFVENQQVFLNFLTILFESSNGFQWPLSKNEVDISIRFDSYRTQQEKRSKEKSMRRTTQNLKIISIEFLSALKTNSINVKRRIDCSNFKPKENWKNRKNQQKKTGKQEEDPQMIGLICNNATVFVNWRCAYTRVFNNKTKSETI